MELRDRWNHLLPDAQPLGADLLARYADEHRHYHDQRHLTEVLDAIDELAASADDPDAVRLAAWFHDAIYDLGAAPGQNEELSAQLAEAELAAYGVDPARVAEIGRLIRLTATHKCDPTDANGAVLADADLRILSRDRERYDEYAAAVREEYDAVSDREFAAGRVAVLERLASSPLYATEHARTAWEAAARGNIERELAGLLPQTTGPVAGLIPLMYLGTAVGAIVAASVLFGRSLGAAPSWPAPRWEPNCAPVMAPVAGTALAAALAGAWFRGVPAKVMSAAALLLATGGAAGLAVCWLRWPQSRPGAGLSERWPYLLLGSIAVLLAGGLLGLARRLRSTAVYPRSPGSALGPVTTVASATVLCSILVAAGPPFTEARLERANTVSSVATGQPGTAAVRLDGGLAWTRDQPATGAIAGTAGGVAEIRPDGVLMSDPATGRVRWRYLRRDIVAATGPDGRGLLVSADGRAVAIHLPRGAPAVAGDIDLPTYGVIDAVSGRVLAEVPAAGTALAVDQSRLIVARDNAVVGHQLGGAESWQSRTDCAVTRGVLVDGQVVVVDACEGHGARIRGLDAGNGERRWEIDLSERFELGADASADWTGSLATVPGTRIVAGLTWTGMSGGSLHQWAVDAGEGKLTWAAAVPGTPRPRLGPQGCDARLTATQASLVMVACRGGTTSTDPDQQQNQQYDVAAVNPTDGTPQWRQLLQVPAALHRPAYPQEGFALLPDGRIVTVTPRSPAGGCEPVLIGTAGVRMRDFAAGASTVKPVTCGRPRITVTAGRPVISDGTRLFALR